jgi:ABC-type dipeptide/oligopeptide/nickel transport system permease subunit
VLGELGASLHGTVIGALSGYVRGAIDTVLMRFTGFVTSVAASANSNHLAALDLKARRSSPLASPAYQRIVMIVALLGWHVRARWHWSSTRSFWQSGLKE